MNAKYSKSLHVLLTPEQHKKVVQMSKFTGFSMGDIIRILVDAGEQFILHFKKDKHAVKILNPEAIPSKQ